MDKKTKQRISMLRRWLKALRSGKYQQADGQLRRGEGITASYCCLGVACQIFGAKFIKDGMRAIYKGRSTVSREDWMPSYLARDLGLAPEEQAQLAGYNDNKKPFGYIADYIEKKHLKPAIARD